MDFWTGLTIPGIFPPWVMSCYIPHRLLVRVLAWFPHFSLHDAYMIIGKNRQSKVQSPTKSSRKIPLNWRLNRYYYGYTRVQNHESRIMDFWTAPESRQSSPADQFTVMSPMLAEWLFLWICRHFTNYYTCSGSSMYKKMCKIDCIKRDECEASRSISWYECQVDHRRGAFSVTHIQRRHSQLRLIIQRISCRLRS